jgi:hypothetical protein
MKGSRTLTFAVLVALTAAPAVAQPAPAARSPLVRADVQGTLGWFNAESNISNRYDEWYNRSLYGGAGFGWYWTDHLKTELEVGATSAVELYGNEPVVIGGQPRYLSFRQAFSTKKLTAAQHYQFYRNVWFHPHLAAGIDLSWETITRRSEPLFFYDQVTRQSRLERPAENLAPETSLHARPFAAAGFKAYMTQRSFFRSDLRFGIGSGVDEVLLRFGFGMDF